MFDLLLDVVEIADSVHVTAEYNTGPVRSADHRAPARPIRNVAGCRGAEPRSAAAGDPNSLGRRAARICRDFRRGRRSGVSGGRRWGRWWRAQAAATPAAVAVRARGGDADVCGAGGAAGAGRGAAAGGGGGARGAGRACAWSGRRRWWRRCWACGRRGRRMCRWTRRFRRSGWPTWCGMRAWRW